MLSWEDYYKDEAPVKKEETKNPEPRVAEVTETQTAEVKQSVETEQAAMPENQDIVTEDITEKQLKTLVDNIYKEIKEKGKKVKSKFIGEKVLQHLKEINEVAYLRYASVYKEFSDVSDFEKEVAEFN